MAGTDLIEQRRLVLQVARDVAAQGYLRILLVLADTALAAHRDELLALDGRIKRVRPKRGPLTL
jgi:ABC-type hemin transport system ATPase subunit